MNFSTGIKSKAAALELLSKAITKPVEGAKISEAQRAYNEAESALDKIAVESAIARVKSYPADVDVVNVTIRTGAGAQELLSVHIVKH